VNNGLAQYMRPSQLKASGFEEYMGQVPAGWEETFQEALATGVPEPYGRNCQQVYKYLSDAIGQIRTDQAVAGAIRAGDEITAKQRIREILQQQVVFANQRMLNILPPDEKRFRVIIASIVTVAILIAFSFVLYRVFKVFTPEDLQGKGGWQFGKYKWAYLAMLPAIGTIALWIYYPLARGTIMAFQDYNVRGFSQFVGMENFANALFDTAFWHSMWVSLQYAMIFMVFGFAAPIVLAILLTEVPRGRLLFRTIYYLPAVLTGIVVIFLWKGFYGPYGLINQVLNCVIGLMNHLPHVQFSEIHTTWTDSPRLALFFVLLPTVWAGMGPGCLIYLAALKTIPEEMYEAADVDGAGICAKLVQVTLPSIKALVLINFIGAMIGAMRSGGDFVLAMTGGGPYTPRGQTEVIGLQIFYQAFFYLRFGLATAMAWILGAMLIGFTVMQLQRLSRMEFRAAGSAK
jgi:multiple sugar transport system permease protein